MRCGEHFGATVYTEKDPVVGPEVCGVTCFVLQKKLAKELSKEFEADSTAVAEGATLRGITIIASSPKPDVSDFN